MLILPIKGLEEGKWIDLDLFVSMVIVWLARGDIRLRAGREGDEDGGQEKERLFVCVYRRED